MEPLVPSRAKRTVDDGPSMRTMRMERPAEPPTLMKVPVLRQSFPLPALHFSPGANRERNLQAHRILRLHRHHPIQRGVWIGKRLGKTLVSEKLSEGIDGIL